MNNSYAKFCLQYMYTDENLNDAQLLKFVSKSGRSRVEDSPPINLQTVVIGQLFNFTGNVPQLGELAKKYITNFKNCQN